LQIAWDGYCKARKSPITRKAGNEFADPGYDLSVDWLATRAFPIRIGIALSVSALGLLPGLLTTR
jgi:hypothetical protein